jgi:hypothetical protein
MVDSGGLRSLPRMPSTREGVASKVSSQLIRPRLYVLSISLTNIKSNIETIMGFANSLVDRTTYLVKLPHLRIHNCVLSGLSGWASPFPPLI